MSNNPKRTSAQPGVRRAHSHTWFGVTSAIALPGLLVLANAFGVAPPKPVSADPARLKLDRQFVTTVKPFIGAYCAPCHGKKDMEAQLDLTRCGSLVAVMGDDAHWSRVLDKLSSNQMPPSTASAQPPAEQRSAVVAWIRAVRDYEASQRKDTGDPGPVLGRRLSNAEYDYTIRDLTGVDLKPTKEFPVDPANQEGFDNSGESLTLSGALVKKYVSAAKDISEHMVLTSTGIEFASHPVMVETDRDKFCILRIVDFYDHQPTDIADYFEAAWRFRYRAALGHPDETLPSVAARSHVSARYLATVWDTLNSNLYTVGPIAKLQNLWNALPAPENDRPDVAHPGCVGIRDWVKTLRKKVAWKFDNLPVPGGFSAGGQCFVLWKDRAYASHRRAVDPAMLHPMDMSSATAGQLVSSAKNPIDADTVVPADDTARGAYMDSFNRFCSVFPDAFYVKERGRMFVDEPGDQGRLLTAGLHNSMGYFRDDTPLMEMILDDDGQKKLDRLWEDFDTVARIPERMHLEFFVYERAESGTITDPEFNFARAEDQGALTDEKIKLLGDLYYAKAKRNGAQQQTLDAISDHFKRVSVNIRNAEKERLAEEPIQRKALIDFARRAYRRPLTAAEVADIQDFYQELRQKDGEGHEEAMRDSVERILLSPNFLFRLDLEPATSASSGGRSVAIRLAGSSAVTRVSAVPPPSANAAYQPLSDYDLASRLSYFLWSSMPDDELLQHAAAGDLHKPDVLAAQTRRMLRDPRVRALALEFGGNWLDFRRFDQSNTVDRNRFPSFTNDLREAMFEEPIRFLVDTFQNNQSILNMLYGHYTFVNADLAKHYEMTDVNAPKDSWVRVDNADKYGRGGLLPMAVFLTENSPGLRTSPVKRGYWVVKRVLGEYIPPPPPTVPELPKDESKLGDITLRQALERHRKDPACAGCHARFDSYGLVFEGYDPIGSRRTKDLGQKPIDDHAPFPGSPDREGVTGLQSFIEQQRQKDFVDTFDRKLYSYALGRSLQPSDEPVLLHLAQKVSAGNYKFEALAEAIVTSRQFRYRRVAPAPASPALARN